MEILLDVPPLLHQLLQWILEVAASLSLLWTQFVDHGHTLRHQLSLILRVPPNALLPLTVLLVLFWPVLLYLIMALATAWGWILWLVTSIVFGILQLSYVIYQFFMIACDICGLSLLKSYSMLRAQVLNVFDRSGHSVVRKSQRRLWILQLETVTCYEKFLQIKILEPSQALPAAAAAAITASSRWWKTPSASATPKSVDTALPPPPPPPPLLKQLPRVQSFNTTLTEVPPPPPSLSPSGATSNSSTTATLSPRSILRNRSFSGNPFSSSSGPSLLMQDSLDPVVVQELGERTADLLVTTTQRLHEAHMFAVAGLESVTTRNSVAAAATTTTTAPPPLNGLLYLLSGVVKRNHLNLDEFTVENARSIAARGVYGLSQSSRQVIRAYYRQVEQGLDLVAEAPCLPLPPPAAPLPAPAPHGNSHSGGQPLSAYDATENLTAAVDAHQDLMDRITVVRKMKQNMGRTALMLSGGGAQAMYHLGIIRALIESKQYDNIKVISGTSGGSIAAAMCAIKTTEEMHKEVCVPTVSTDFKGNGEQRRRNIRWFPSLMEMAAYWLKHKLLVDSAMFRETCEFYYGDTTFEEAFEQTGKHVCITVSASRVGDHAAQQRLLLNHISTPHVTLASAVAASCALPGVMAPAKLIAKNSDGSLEPFEVDGVEWIDGSVQADLPFQRISTLFAVSSFIVSQTNFHIVPLLNKAHHPNSKSAYWQIFQTIEWDIRSRALKLSRLGLFPKFFGQDISKVFKQRYHGNLTIVPQFTTMQTFGLKALSNPNVKDMEGYLKYGQIATWPYLNAIRDMIRLEKAVDDCLHRLEERMRAISPELEWSLHDDVESIASGSAVASSSRNVRIVGRPPLAAVSSFRGLGMVDRESERMRKRMTALELENDKLRQELERLRQTVGIPKSESRDEGDDRDDERRPTLSDGSEGAIWGFVLRRKASK